jgi:HK97 family phage prohead protease
MSKSKNPKPETVRMTRVARAAEVRAASFNADARTVEVVVASETPVRRFGFLENIGFGEFDEVLSMDGIDSSRFSNAPLADSHDLSSVRNVFGRVESFRVESDKLIATVKFSRKAAAQEVMHDVADGVISQVSVGYKVQEYEIEIGNKGDIPVARATKWTPLEVSLVPVGADPAAVVRASADDEHDVAVRVVDSSAVAPSGDAPAESASDAGADDAEPGDEAQAPAADGDSDSAQDADGDAEEASTESETNDESADPVARARANAAAITRAAAKAGFPEVAASLIESGASPEDAERRFGELSEIRTLARKAGLRELGEELVRKGVSLARAKDTLLKALVERADAVGEITSRPDADREAEQPSGTRSAVRIDAREIYSRLNARQ